MTQIISKSCYIFFEEVLGSTMSNNKTESSHEVREDKIDTVLG